MKTQYKNKQRTMHLTVMNAVIYQLQSKELLKSDII